jgi:hypothetical protein
MKIKPLIERFEERYIPIPESGCWLWIGATTEDGGYGQISQDYRRMLAHRLSWELYNGPIPEGMNVLHHCDTPSCVNPKHLFLGTQLDNAKDCWSKNRHSFPIGELHPGSKLTEDQVKTIRLSSQKSQILADEYNVTVGLIKHIRHRRLWKHI